MSEEAPAKPADDDGAGGKMPLLDHLIELRQRLVKCVVALLVAFSVCFYFSEHIFAFLVVPLKEAFGDGGGRLGHRRGHHDRADHDCGT